MTITRNFKLYLNAGTASAPYINVNQYDEGEEWVFTLYNEDGSTYTPSSGAIIGIKSDGNAIMNAGSVVGGKVVITETEQMTAASGRAIYELLIDNATHGTANFIVNVERRPSDDAEFSDSDLSMLQEAIDAAEVINEILDAGGDPSEIIAENVDAWLDNHPEATTTVQDGAITAPKINNSLWDKILVNEEVSGNPASFEDGADDVPVSSLKVALEPIQTGSGDPSPTNIRPIIASNGKNLLQVTATTQTISGVTFTVENGIITANGTATEALNLFVAQGLSITGGVLSGCPSGGSTSTYYMNGRVNGSWNARDTGSGATFTGTLDQVAITIASGYTCNNLVFKPMIRLSSDTDATYQPYQGIKVDVTGKNLAYVSSGNNIVIANCIKGMTYTFSLRNSDTCGFNLKKNSNSGQTVYGQDRTSSPVISATFTADEDFKLFVNGFSSGDNAFVDVASEYQLEVGTEATEYEEYIAPTSYPYTLGQSVYGGTVDLATGVLTVDKVAVDLGTFTWTAQSDAQGQYFRTGLTPLGSVSLTENICTCYSVVSSTNVGDGNIAMGIIGNVLYVRDTRYSDVSSFTTGISGQLFVYLLATPQTIQLTPTQVKTLLGYNNISSSGTVDVIYHADTKLYIDKKIGELS